MFAAEWIIKGIVIAILWLLKVLGWKRAGERLDELLDKEDKDERPVT